jgi:hypothetical protein
MIKPSEVGDMNSRKRYHLIVLDYHSGLWDDKEKKRVDHLLPMEVLKAGIYNPNRKWLEYYKHYAGKSSVRTIERDLRLKEKAGRRKL